MVSSDIMITPKTLVKHELIGLAVETGAIKGKVVDETKNMITIETEKGVKKVEKKSHEFTFALPDGKRVKVSGRFLSGRPEERVKTRVKKW